MQTDASMCVHVCVCAGRGGEGLNNASQKSSVQTKCGQRELMMDAVNQRPPSPSPSSLPVRQLSMHCFIFLSAVSSQDYDQNSLCQPSITLFNLPYKRNRHFVIAVSEEKNQFKISPYSLQK